MFIRTVFSFAVLIVLVPMLTANPFQKRTTSNLELISVIALEEGCVRQGGLCLRIEDCDPDNLVKLKGVLCPLQKHLGVECCYN